MTCESPLVVRVRGSRRRRRRHTVFRRPRTMQPESRRGTSGLASKTATGYYRIVIGRRSLSKSVFHFRFEKLNITNNDVYATATPDRFTTRRISIIPATRRRRIIDSRADLFRRCSILLMFFTHYPQNVYRCFRLSPVVCIRIGVVVHEFKSLCIEIQNKSIAIKTDILLISIFIHQTHFQPFDIYAKTLNSKNIYRFFPIPGICCLRVVPLFF